ncbi:GNAT family N-acetyltransferase [Agaribacter marinus]|uniref:N-acetyltransferase n=1 Tax=Agaribacter marinus TaxID=1431249 RepID=A0AA37WG24_9ALTE|nr:GNAT family N-acetyltransferase [Agaribacter marinus]GLR69586.1 N-acetyltransferase [Agaribacter marinus]
MKGFKVTTNPDDLDIALVYAFISKTYWAKNIPFETFKKSIANSIVFGAYSAENDQVGFARVTTDKATFAYLGDVFVLEEYRGLGISKLIMQAIAKHSELQGLRRFMLATSDAHGLYAQFGFQDIANPEIFMQIWQPTVYE